MADKQTRPYVVLAKDLRGAGDLGETETLTKLGVVEAGDAEGACIAGMETHGLPEGVKVVVAVPVGNWNACKVEEETRPRFTAKRMSALPEVPVRSSEPEPGE